MANFSKLLKPTKAALLLLLALFGYLAYRYTRARFWSPISFDEEAVVWGGWLMTQGGVPYRDFFEPKPPVIFFANYLGLTLFGFSGQLFRIVPTVLALGSIFVFYWALLKRGVIPWLGALLGAQVALWLLGSEFHDTGLNDSETYGFSFTLLGFSVGSLCHPVKIQSRKAALQVLSGICFGLAVFSKELFVFSALPAWLIAARRMDGGWDLGHLLRSAGGALAVAVGLLVYLVSNSGFGPYLDLIAFYRAFAANYCIDIGRFPRVSGFAIVPLSWQMLNGVLYNFKHLAFVLALALALLILIRRRVNSLAGMTEVVIAFLGVLMGMYAISVGHCFWRHYFLMGTAGLVLLSTLGAESLSTFLSEKGRVASVVAFLGLSALLFYIGHDQTRTMLKETARFQPRGWDPLLMQTIEAHSKPGDYILTTEGPLLYVATNRKSPLGINFFVDEILPYVTVKNRVLQMEILRENLEKHLPKVCYFPAWLRPRQDKHHELLFGPLLAKHHYVKVTDQLWYLPDSQN